MQRRTQVQTGQVKTKVPRRTNLRAQRAEIQGGRDGSWRFQPGKNVLLIVQQPNQGYWADKRVVFWLPEVSSTRKSNAVSAKSFGADIRCPAMEALNALQARDDAVAKQYLTDFRASTRYYANAFVVNERQALEYKVVELPKTVWEVIANAIDAECSIDPSLVAHSGDVLDPPIVSPGNLRFIHVERTGTGISTNYATTVLSKAHTLTSEQLRMVKDLEGFKTATDEVEMEQRVCLQLGISSLDELVPNTSSLDTSFDTGVDASASSVDVDDLDFEFDDDEEEL